MKCPFCDGQLEATVTVDCDVDERGNVVATATGGSFRLYCENDCDEWADGEQDHAGWPTKTDVADYIKTMKGDV